MSHFSVLVITPEKPDEQRLDRLMSPYREKANSSRSKWDWYQIGGRWTGALRPDYDPAKDPANIETCSLCAGTGQRNDELGRKTRATDPTYNCNGCSGEGKRVKWPTEWAPFGGDQQQIAALDPAQIKPPFAVLKDGEWYERGEMGWWGMARNEKDKDVWAAEFRKLLDGLPPETWLTVVDCHI